MKIVLAPDSFKGSVSSIRFCEAAELAIKGIDSNIEVFKFPLADGGEGTAECVAMAMGTPLYYKEVSGPLRQRVKAALYVSGVEAVIELAQASGLPLLREGERNPMLTTTYGTGELILEALERGCRRITVGLGGSATNDGAVGLLSALGFRFLDSHGRPVPDGAQGFAKISSIDCSGADPRLSQTDFFCACDVENPLCGPNGASAVFGPQKGATPEMVSEMDQGLINFAQVIKHTTGREIAAQRGAGAAGGAGAGLMAFLNAKFISGADFIKEATGFTLLLEKEKIDLVITGEGEINGQTACGKLPGRVAAEAKKYGIPVVALVGKIGQGAELTHEQGVTAIFSITDGPMTLQQAMQGGGELVSRAVREVVSLFIALNGRN